MDINTQYFKVNKTARYVTYGNLSEQTKYFWFALHGSNMRCEQMLYKFSDFNPEEHFVVAPEALSRFYKDGFGGEVVAAWMTSRDRLEEIADFSNYLSSLYELYTAQLPVNCKKIAMGFSQGGTTLFRWLHHLEIDTDILLAYSCWVPEDIDLSASKTNLDTIKTFYTYGEQDQFLTPDRMVEVQKVISKNRLDLALMPYEGDHRVSREQLMKLLGCFSEDQ